MDKERLALLVLFAIGDKTSEAGTWREGFGGLSKRVYQAFIAGGSEHDEETSVGLTGRASWAEAGVNSEREDEAGS